MSIRGETFVIHPDMVFREEDEGAFMFNPQTNALHCMNRVGAFICRSCDGKNDLDAICRSLQEEYEVDVEPDQLKADVQTFLDEMLNLELLQVQEKEGGVSDQENLMDS